MLIDTQSSAVSNSSTARCFNCFSMDLTILLSTVCMHLFSRMPLHIPIVISLDITFISRMSVCYCHSYRTGVTELLKPPSYNTGNVQLQNKSTKMYVLIIRCECFFFIVHSTLPLLMGCSPENTMRGVMFFVSCHLFSRSHLLYLCLSAKHTQYQHEITVIHTNGLGQPIHYNFLKLACQTLDCCGTLSLTACADINSHGCRQCFFS